MVLLIHLLYIAGEICDLACGGQILLGPRTYQKWVHGAYTETPGPEGLQDLMGAALREGSAALLGRTFSRRSFWMPSFRSSLMQKHLLRGAEDGFLPTAGGTLILERPTSISPAAHMGSGMLSKSWVQFPIEYLITSS